MPRFPRTAFRRIELIVDAAPAASTASLPLVHLNNLDSGSNLWSGREDEIFKAFEALGFDVSFSYSPPRG